MANELTTLNFGNKDRYSANEAIDNFILGSNLAKQYKHKYITNDEVPCCDMDNKIIYSPVLPAITDSSLDKVIRGKNEHEAGHARFTPSNKNPQWSKVKGQLINALEDQRIERGVKSMSKAFESDIDYLNRFMIDKLNTNWMTNGCTAKPIDEAIMALHIMECGHNPLWTISSDAEMYINSAKDIYAEWVNADYNSTSGFAQIEDITDRIIAIWEKMQDNNSSSNNSDDKKDEEKNNDSDDNSDSKDSNNSDSNNSDNSTDESDSNNTDENMSNDNSDSADNDSNNSSKSNKGKSSKPQSSLDELCDDKNDLENVLKEELKKAFDETKADFNGYTAYTAEDVIIKAVKNIEVFEDSKRKIVGAISMLASYMEQSLRTQSRCRNIGNRDKGYLDRTALPLIAKNLTKNIFYTKRQGISLDTTVSILIDESGSMWGTHLHCRCMAIALAEVLERLEIKFEILGHTTGGIGSKLSANDLHKFNRTKKMIIFEHKNFNESYRNEKYRLGSIGHYNCNADSEALLTTFKRAMEQKSSRHIIMVLSDGCPSGAKTGGEKHLCKVVDFCRKNGAEVYAFGIGTDEPKQFYGDDNFVYLKSADELNGQFFRQLSNIIIKGSMC
jgi:cobalamin biosynthesis protein CobT